MNNINKFNLGLFIVILILFIIVLFLTYSKKEQPTKEEAYKKGVGYYTTEESLGCVNSSLKCSEPGTETFIQYCVPHPVTGRGCISSDGKETYNTVFRQKPCNIHCNSHKFVVEDQIQVKNPGRDDNLFTTVTGSGCNKVIDETLGLDYTDFFLGDYQTENNTYQLKSCIPGEGYTGYYQKIYTCQRNDSKGDNNCVYSCGSEGNILGINGIFGSKLSKNLLKYFPTELDTSGNKRYVCYDLNGVDQIDILNYSNKVPTDFVYPNLCYKHTTVLNYNGELWPNSDSSNVFVLPLSNYQPDSEFFSVDGNSLQNLLGSEGLLTNNYNIFTDYNSYVKIYLGNEIVLLNRILPAGVNNQIVNLYYNNTSSEITQRDTNHPLIFYIFSKTKYTGSVGTTGTFVARLFGGQEQQGVIGTFKYTFSNSDNENYYQFNTPPGTLNTTTPEDKIINHVTYPNPSPVLFSFIPLNFSIYTSNGQDRKISFISIPFNGEFKNKVIYFEIKVNNINNYVWCIVTNVDSDVVLSENIKGDSLLVYKTLEVNIKYPTNLDLTEKIILSSPIYVFNSNVVETNSTMTVEIPQSEIPDRALTFNMTKSFKTSNVIFNNFIKPDSENFNILQQKNTSQLKLQNNDIATNYLEGNFYSLTSGNPWSLKNSSQVINFTFVSNGNYTAVINDTTYTFTFDTTWNVDSGMVTVTNKELDLLDGDTYILTPKNNLIYTTSFYFYGTDQSNSDLPFYYYPLMVLNDSTVADTPVSFIELPDYNIDTVNLKFDNIPPSNTEEFTYLDLNVTSGIADANFEYVEINTNSYFIRNLTRRTNLGSYQTSNKLFLFNTELLINNLTTPNFQFINYQNIQNISWISQYYMTEESNKNILQLIRRGSLFFENFYNVVTSTYQERKINQYLEMISEQNTDFTESNISNDKFNLIILPQKTVTISADYRVFKSPYTISDDGTYNFLCYNDNGSPKAKGTRISLGENEKMYVNKSCTDYNVEGGDATCGVIGISSPGNGTSLTPCEQVRITQNANFLEECIPYTQDKYNTVGNLFESGIVLREMLKSKEMGGKIDNSVNVFKDFFTREEEVDRVYKPDEELYTNKNQQNFYLSLKDNNTDFVVEPSGWERVFTYQNLTKSVTFQNHLFTENQITLKTPINLGLNGQPEENLISGNFGYRMVFKNSKSGINTQNFLYTGVQFYYDTNNGADYNIYNSSLQTISSSLTAQKEGPFVVDGKIYKNKIWNPNTLIFKFIPIKFNYLSTISNDTVVVENNSFIYSNKLNSFERIRNCLNFRITDNVINEFKPLPKNFIKQNKNFEVSYSYSNPINIDNINTFISTAIILKVTQEKKIENLIKFTIIDNNLLNEYSDVVVGDYINLDENFFGQLFFNLLGGGEKSENVILSGYTNSYNNSTGAYPKLGDPDKTETSIETSRVLHIYGSLDNKDIVYVTDNILNGLKGNGIVQLNSKGFSNTTLAGNGLETFVSETNIELFDILVFYKVQTSENPYFAKVIKIEVEKDSKGNTSSYTLTFEKDIKGTLSENNLSGKGVFFNLKKTGSVIDNYYKIVEITGNKISFYFNIGDYTINDFQSEKGGNIIYDSKLVNFNTNSNKFIESYTNTLGKNKPEIPLNTFSYFISARYIKNKVQIPFVQLNDKLFASMTRKNDTDYYDTKILSYVTGFTSRTIGNQKFFYLNEFREDYGYENPQVEKTFSINDTIKYITKNGTGSEYTEEDIAIFKIIDTEILLDFTWSNVKINSKQQTKTLKIKYDYQCILVDNIQNSNLNNLSQNKVDIFTSSKLSNFSDSTTQENIYKEFSGFSPTGSVYQLPYIGYPYDSVKRTDFDKKLQQIIIIGSENETVFVVENLPSSGIITEDIKSFNPFFVSNDYQNFAFSQAGIFVNDKISVSIIYKTSTELQTNPEYSCGITYPSTHIRGNRLDVLRLVSTELRSVKNPTTDYININIERLTGKGYGSEIVLNATNSENLTPNYNRIGNITQFTINNSNIDNSEIGDIFESNKGFQLILTEESPSEYEFVSIEKNNKITPFETQTDQVITPYNKDDIVSIIDRNIRQYFRNTSSQDSKFNFKLQQSSDFEIIPKTIYPQDEFIDYHPDVFYQKGEIVKFSSDTQLSGLYITETSNFGEPVNTVNNYWLYKILNKDMESNNQQFYSFVYPNSTITKGDDLNEIITKTKELNNLNLPLEIKTFDSDNKETDFCPTFCTVTSETKTLKQIINDSFVGKLDYFDDIRYLFETPVLIRQKNNKKYITIGHSPVSFDQNNEYNVTFLSNSNQTTNLISQFLYFLNLENDTKIYNKPKCNQNFIHYNTDGDVIDTGVSSFEFSNSLVFQFFPCDLKSQDYISYTTEDNNIVTLDDTKNILWNRFPPINGLTKSGGTSIPLISQNGDTFSGVSETFESSYLTLNIPASEYFYGVGTTVSLTHSGGDSVNLTINEIGNTLEGVGVSEAISNNGTCYSYGDIWHLTPKGGTSILTYGFVVPEENGKLTDKSFIQIKDFSSNPENCSIFINSNTGSGFCMSGVSGFNYIRDYTLTKVSGTTDGIYTGGFNTGTIQANIKFDSSGNILQRNQAEVSPAVTSGTCVFFPSYNAKENIKVKALATFGNNYLANITYNNRGFKTLENNIIPTGIFEIYSNGIFSNQVATSSTNVLVRNRNLSMTGLVDVMKIKFNSESFDVGLNHFSLPINNDSSNLIQRKGVKLGAVNSNSVNEFIVEEIKNVIGVSVGLDFNQFIDSNLDYVTPSGSNKGKIPGNTNTQIQIREIRQNTTTDYIDPNDNCSLFFEPELLPTTNLDGDSIFLDDNNNSNQGGTADVTVNKLQNLYLAVSSINQRFNLVFDSAIKYESNSPVSFYLGNNLTYYFNQTDVSNDNYPIVFSTSGTDFKNNIITVPEENFGGGIVKLSFFLDFKEVSQAEYINLSNFNKSKQERRVKFMFQSNFDVTTINVSLFYGFNSNDGQQNGGKFEVIYH